MNKQHANDILKDFNSLKVGFKIEENPKYIFPTEFCGEISDQCF